MRMGWAAAPAVVVASSAISMAIGNASQNTRAIAQPGTLHSDSGKDMNPSASSYPLKLLQVQVLFRHGDRSPMPLGTPTAEEAARWESRLQARPEGLPEQHLSRGLEYPFGQLTQKGAQQAFALGKQLRERYGELLGPPLESGDVRIRATSFPRTYLTGHYVLGGVLGSQEAAVRVPIGVRDVKDENLFNNDHCARGQVLWGTAWRQLSRPPPHMQEIGWRSQHPHLKQAMAAAFNIDAEKKFPWVLAIDNVDCRHQHGDALPAGVTPEDIQQVRKWLAHDYRSVFATQEACQLAMGPLLDELVTTMEHAIVTPAVAGGASGKSNGGSPGEGARCPLLALYSGHDATLMPLAAALGVELDTWPPYASAMCFELWASSDNAQHFVRVLYNGKEVRLPVCPPSRGATWHDRGPWQQKGAALYMWQDFLRLTDWSRLTREEYKRGCQITSSL
eukprot:jgi/Mesen1/7848/ME000042S07291